MNDQETYDALDQGALPPSRENYIAAQAIEAAKNQVQVLKLEPGDVLVVKLGIADMGEGLPPWIPGPQELEAVRDDLEAVLPDGVSAIVHHFGLDFEVVRNVDNAAEVWVEPVDA